MFESVIKGSLTINSVMLCTLCSLLCGTAAALSACAGQKRRISRNMLICLVIIPVTVQFVIMMVNGSIGAGVAVAGAFSLVRFRSVPGNARDISLIFLAMAAGLATGMGYVGYALLFTVLICGIISLMSVINLGGTSENMRQLKVTIPEDLDYDGIFDDVFGKFTSAHELSRVKTTNMGTLYELVYIITEKENISEKEMIDEIRCRNGNLTVICGRTSDSSREEL